MTVVFNIVSANNKDDILCMFVLTNNFYVTPFWNVSSWCFNRPPTLNVYLFQFFNLDNMEKITG